jgi:DNA-binding NtrC family response regulator
MEERPEIVLRFPLGTSLHEIEDEIFRQVETLLKGNRFQAARALNIHPVTLFRRLGPSKPRKQSSSPSGTLEG